MFCRRSCIQSAKTRLGADCGSDHELLIAKFRLKLKKVGKTTTGYDLNQIPYDYTVEVRNRFKGLDLASITSWQIDGEIVADFFLDGQAPKSLQMVTAALKLKDACSSEEKL